jgi:hypothetical protein
VNLDAVRRIADAVLYEGYILYPYRASAQKNRSRWQFGVLMPPGYAMVDPSEPSSAQTQCVLEHAGAPTVQVVLRFLQVQRRTTDPPEPGAQAWDEAVEREVEFTVGTDESLGAGLVREFSVPGGEDREAGPGGFTIRRREPLVGLVDVTATPVPGPWRAVRLRVRVQNQSAGAGGSLPRHRDEALPSALVAAHVILAVSGGQFVSMTDPPEWAKPAVAGCENAGTWPVLADPDGGRSVVLASPIILYDYPELAPESPGDLYDGTEIDEILTLRTLALSDDEKLEARATDPRAAALIDRVESLDAQAMAGLHGTLFSSASGAGRDPSPGGSGAGRDPSPGGSGAGRDPFSGASGAGRAPRPGVPQAGPDVPWWDPEADASVSPDTDSVLIGGQLVARGSLVRLRPGGPATHGGPGARRADAQDMFLAGRIAEVQAVLTDVEDRPYLAVSLTDDPDADLRVAHGRFLYFMPDEVEALP